MGSCYYTITDQANEIILSKNFTSLEAVVVAARGTAKRLLKHKQHDKDETVYVNVYKGIKKDRDSFRFSVTAIVETHISYNGPK